uniref:SUN domain-containing protein n=1 Tax=Setaria digitata TaxID=48799 RepID=A0A915PDQ2_9BILA
MVLAELLYYVGFCSRFIQFNFKTLLKMELAEAGIDAIVSTQEVDLVVPFPSEQPPIVTFDEWTKEKLKKEEIRKAEQQQQSQQHKSIIHADIGEVSKTDSNASPTSKIAEGVTRLAQTGMISQEAAARNYASKECGAKVLFSNEEAENKNAVLNEKEADDYMRNPCERAEHKWLIIELCETIQPTVLEIANFELFSSGPQNVRISGSERYPSNDWIVLGDFIAENNREIQRFSIAARSYVKFLRLELLSHYGREHYCTLSLVRLLGISMVDEYEAEAEAAAISDTSFSFPVAVNSTSVEKMNDAITTADVLREDVLLLTETENETANELPFVDAVVNAVGNIGIGNIKGVFESTFLSKPVLIPSHHIARSSITVVELCTKCFVDPVVTHVLFCRAFFQFQYNFTDNNIAAQHKQAIQVRSSIKNQIKKRAQIVEVFLTSVLPTSVCDLELEIHKTVPNSTSYNQIESNDRPTVPSVLNSTTTSNLLNGKLKREFMIPGGVISHKESIFLKLNKRISSLELNMSLSSEYLSELSRRYVLQTNESRRQVELIIKQAEEAAVNAIKPSINALKIQMDALAASLRELTETVKGLPQESASVHRTMIIHTKGGGDDTGASLARSQAHFNGYLGVWTSGELVCIFVLMNVLTLLILLLLHYVLTVINRSAVGQVVEDRLQKFIQDNNDVRPASKTYSEQQLLPEVSTVVYDVVNGTQAANECSSSLALPNETYSMRENETKEESYPDMSYPVNLVERPLSRLSTRSEQNPWQTRKRRNKKHKKNLGIGKSRDSFYGLKIGKSSNALYGFKILSNLGTD